ncbi:hypothetical protein [Neisseria polysaccharea]|uniref:hypothetical protein n=1 Tax=Neisseria polysaccharea TaxID=489 RepID=UPI0027DF9E81|nr:hypothetical protein [Neisseria polysaccharea]
MKDNWCNPLKFRGKLISGGAARNVRISQSGGMEEILQAVAREAAENAFNRANEIQKEKPHKLRMVK